MSIDFLKDKKTENKKKNSDEKDASYYMNVSDLQKIEVYCKDNTCGDPIPSFDGSVRYTRRRMVFAGWGLSLRKIAVFRCPVCDKKREFAFNIVTDGYHEV